MPFKDASDPSLPPNIKAMPANKRSQFVSVFNSSHNSCMKNGGKNCEAEAFKRANGVVKESDSMRIDDCFNLDINEASFNEPKKELVVTLLKEGPGNKSHKNYYTKSALNTALKEVQSRPKQFFNHAKDVDNPDRDLRDWASSIVETWVDTSEPKSKLKAKVKVLDNWLWERAKVASNEMAVSIEGKGSGRKETIEGSEYNAIYEINRVNGVNWVDYPGNAGMGVEVLEKDKIEEVEEEKKMLNLTEILEGLKELPKDELKEIASSRPELKEFFLFPPSEKEIENEKQIGGLKESLKGITDKVSALEKEKGELANKVEAHEIKEKANQKEKLVDKLLSESKMKDEYKSELFKKTLIATEKEEDMKHLIEDREKICITEIADPSQTGAGKQNIDMSEDDKLNKFALNIFGEELKEKEEKKEDK